jgi:K(+)-stimulated pyrophosphate-energized sodium pump
MSLTVPLSLAAIDSIPALYVLAPIGGILALIMAQVFSRSVMKRSEGDEEMVRIAQAVREGAMAYLFRQYKVVAIVFVLLVAFLGIMYLMGLQPGLTMIGVPIAGLLSGLTGWFGMRMATNASARTANAAKQSLNDGLTVAFRSGAVMGLNVVGFAILDASFWFLVLNALDIEIRTLTTIMLSFGMGASTQALFARVGGGIYTKAADVGADLVGKVEAGIPEDDARNPATIADNVGDNVGDVAGMGADLYESYYGSMLATMALGAAAAFTIVGLNPSEQTSLALKLAAAPLALAGLGIICSILGIFTVRAKENATFAQLLKGLHTGVWVASALIIVVAFGILYFLLGGSDTAAQLSGGSGEPITSWWWLGLSIVSGLIAGLVIAQATEYYTSYEHPPTRRIAQQALTGPATVIIAGIAEGMKSTWAGLLTIIIAIIAAFTFAGGNENFLMGLYGVAIAAVGMLATLGITLATDAYGPIADNAGGNAEMTGQPPHVRQRTDMLDSLGNTTAATGKGFAIGSAALTALALFAAYVQVVQVQINSQSEAFVRRGNYTAPAGAQAYAVYEGHRKFALVFPGAGREGGDEVEGGMLIDADRVRMVDDHGHEPGPIHGADFRVGQVVPIVRGDRETLVESRRVTAVTMLDHGGHQDEVEFELVSAKTGTIGDVLHFYDVNLTNPRVLGGLFSGVLITFLFCALTMSAVGRAAYSMMAECRRQFAIMRQGFRAQGMDEAQIADPEQWPKRIEVDGKQYPDYANCVSISTAGAQREMILPAIIAITVPILVGLLLNVPGVMGLLAGGLSAGFAVAVFMANAGGAWDNAKKLIESYGRITADKFLDDPATREKIPAEIRAALQPRAEEMRRTGRGGAYVYGKGSDDHKATVVGDTVGDPFKDTSGPSLNILIKLISIVSVVFAGLIVKYGPVMGELIGLH